MYVLTSILLPIRYDDFFSFLWTGKWGGCKSIWSNEKVKRNKWAQRFPKNPRKYVIDRSIMNYELLQNSPWILWMLKEWLKTKPRQTFFQNGNQLRQSIHRFYRAPLFQSIQSLHWRLHRHYGHSTGEELTQFVTAVNSFHPALKYT